MIIIITTFRSSQRKIKEGSIRSIRGEYKEYTEYTDDALECEIPDAMSKSVLVWEMKERANRKRNIKFSVFGTKHREYKNNIIYDREESSGGVSNKNMKTIVWNIAGEKSV